MIDLHAVASQVDSASVEDSVGQAVVRVDPGDYHGLIAAARDAGFGMFIDLCAVDYLSRDPRFEIVVNLLSLSPPQRVRVLCGVPGMDPTIASITSLFAGANFYEREAYDLFGVHFEGHPDLTRILLPDEWAGHPLRKDTPVGSVPVQIKEST